MISNKHCLSVGWGIYVLIYVLASSCSVSINDSYSVSEDDTEREQSASDSDPSASTDSDSDTVVLVDSDFQTETDKNPDTLPDSEWTTEPENTTDSSLDSDFVPDSGDSRDTTVDSETESETEPENSSDKCVDDLDNDGDGLVNCADLDCLETSVCDCLDGSVEKEPCGVFCGQAQKICMNGGWSPLGECQDEGVCQPDDVEYQDCDDCSVQSKKCLPDCTWSGWGKCERIPDCTSCDGVAYDGHCWYLGDSGKSCQEICSKHGGYSPKTVQYVGTASQGGSIAKCLGVINALGIAKSVKQGQRHDGKGLGCHKWQGKECWWLNSPSFNSSHKDKEAQLVCACYN